MIEEALQKILKEMKSPRPCHVNRISQLDDPCVRRLYYYRAEWEKMPEIDDGLQGIFATGNLLEPVIERLLSQLGEVADPAFRIVGTQTPTRDNLLEEHQISGRIDGFWQVRENGQWFTKGVVDIKTSNPTIFSSLSDYESLSKYSWTRKYRGQLMLYALAHNLEHCVLVFVNKTNLYDIKLIEFDIDMKYCDELLEKAKQVNAAIDNNSPPEKLNDPDECPRCPFNAICMPEYVTGEDVHISTDSELEGVLQRLEELIDVEKEIKSLEKRRDTLLVKGRNMIVGPFLILWKKVKGERKPSPGGSYEYWRKKIVKQG